MNMETVNVWAQLIASIGVIISLFLPRGAGPAKHALSPRHCR
jgi:hypothetical protein